MITITTPVEVAPTLVRAFERERVGRERTNQLVLYCCGHDDYHGDDRVDYNTCTMTVFNNLITMHSKDKPAGPVLWRS